MAAESSRAALAGLNARELTKRAEQRGVEEERVRRAEADNPEDPRAALIELILAQRPPMRRGGKLAVFLEFCGGQPHHTLFEFSDAVPLHARIRTPTAASVERCRVGSPAQLQQCTMSETEHNEHNMRALTAVGQSFRGEAPKHNPEHPNWQHPVCRYRLGSFLSRPTSNGGAPPLAETHPHCFAATVHTRPGLSYWRHAYAAEATGPAAEAAKLSACALAISDWFAQGANPAPAPPASYSFALRGDSRGPQFKLLRGQQVRESAESPRSKGDAAKGAILPKDSVVEAIAAVSDEPGSARQVLVGVAQMTAPHVATLLRQCGLDAVAPSFLAAGVDGAALLDLRDRKSKEQDPKVAQIEDANTLKSWCEEQVAAAGGNIMLRCTMKTQRTILRAVEEIETSTSGLSGWITVPSRPRRSDALNGSSSDSDEDDMEAQWATDTDGELASPMPASSPRVSAAGLAAVYAPPYAVVGESKLGGHAKMSRRQNNHKVLSRMGSLRQEYSHTEVTLRTTFALGLLEAFIDAECELWTSRARGEFAGWGVAHTEVVRDALASAAEDHERWSVGVDDDAGALERPPNTDAVIELLLQAERGDMEAEPALRKLYDLAKLEEVSGLQSRLR